MLTSRSGKSFAKCTHSNCNFIFKTELGDKSGSSRTNDAKAVGLINHELRVSEWKDFFRGIYELFQRAKVTIHAVVALNGNDDGSLSGADERLCVSDIFQYLNKRLEVIVTEEPLLERQADFHTRQRSGMHKFIVNNDISRAWDSREDGLVGCPSRVNDKC